MTKIERAKEPFEYMLGKKSHINLAGKIILFPILVYAAALFGLMELLFSKDEVE